VEVGVERPEQAVAPEDSSGRGPHGVELTRVVGANPVGQTEMHDDPLLPLLVVALHRRRKPVGRRNRKLEAFAPSQPDGEREDRRRVPSAGEADETRRPQERRHDRALECLQRRSGFSRRRQPLWRRQSEDEPRGDLEAAEDQSRRCSVRCACASRSARASRIVPSASSSHSDALAPFVLWGGVATRGRWGRAFPAALASNLGEPPGARVVPPKVPLASRRAHATKVESADRLCGSRVARPQPGSP
jgi:hypothetical protein